MQDYTAKSERTAVEKLIQDQTGKDYKKFRNGAVAQAIGELIQGNTPTRRAFEKKVVNEAIEKLLFQSLKKNTTGNGNPESQEAQTPAN